MVIWVSHLAAQEQNPLTGFSAGCQLLSIVPQVGKSKLVFQNDFFFFLPALLLFLIFKSCLIVCFLPLLEEISLLFPFKYK